MKKNILKMLIVFEVLIFTPKVWAHPVFVSSSSVYVGDSFTAGFTLTTAAWDVSMTASGPVSGCSFHEVSDSGTGYNTTKTFSATCNATGVGVINISISGNHTSDTSDYAETISGSATVNVSERPYVPPSNPGNNNNNHNNGGGNNVNQTPKNTNNFLSSLEVSKCELKPKFNKEELNYTCADVTVDSIEIKATAEESKSTVNGIGIKSIISGENKFEVSVVSESGDTRVYNITVIKKNIPSTKVNKIIVNELEIPINNETTVIGLPKGTENVDLKAITDSNTAKVKIKGNDKLKPGYNVIEVYVSDTNCKDKKYNVIIYIPEYEIISPPITMIDDNNIINLYKNSAYTLEKDTLGIIKNKLTYNILNKYDGVIASMEINGKKILEEDFDLFFIYHKDKVYTNIFSGTKVKVLLNSNYKIGDKVYIYEVKDNKKNLIKEMKINNMYVDFTATDSTEYLIIKEKLNAAKKFEGNGSAFTENFMISLFVILLIIVFLVIIKKGKKSKKKKTVEENKGVVTENITNNESKEETTEILE